MRKIFIFSTFLILSSFYSCDKPDWFNTKEGEEYREWYTDNLIETFKENFEKEFGAIDAKQSWDFTVANPLYAYSRATSMNDAISQTKLNSQWDSEWTIVDQSVVNKIAELLPEGDDNHDVGKSFSCSVPNNGFTITPIYQGGNSCTNVTLHMVVTDLQGNQKDYLIWSKGDHLQKTSYTASSCTVCKGEGVVKSGDVIGSWDGKVYTIKTTNGNRYLNGTSLSKKDSKDYAVITIEGTKYLFCVSDKKFISSNNGKLTEVTSYENASALTYANNGSFKLGNYYLNYDSGFLGWGAGLSLDKNSYTNWNWSSSNANSEQKKTVNNVLSKVVECDACHGTGKADSWIPANNNITYGKDPGYDGTTMGSPWTEPSAGIRSQSLHINKDDLPVGATISFYTTATSGRTNYIHSSFPNGGKNYPEIIYLSESQIGGRPSNLKNEDSEFMLISCEAGADSDQNDVLFLIEGEPYVPKPLDVTNSEQDVIISNIEKRYMIEDLGSTDDFDYNDVVVDVYKQVVQKYRLTFTNGKETSRTKVGNEVTSEKAIIRALGGTLDVDLKIGDTTWSKHEDFNAFTMYNTGTATGIKGSDGHSTYDGSDIVYTGNGSNLKEFVVTGWDPDRNNISVTVHPNRRNSSETTSSEDVTKQEFTIENLFPEVGQTPMIIAVDTPQKWEVERIKFVKLKDLISRIQK